VRLIEVRLLDGPNVYRLAPAVRIEVAVGRRRTWYGERLPARHAVVRLGVIVRPKDAPSVVVELASWVRRLHRRALGTTAAVTIHRTSEPGRWVVAYLWSQRGTAEAIAQAALRLTDESVSPRLLERALKSIAEADGGGPNWITDDQRKVPVISISGTNGKSTTTRMISHIALLAGRHVGTTTTDGVLVDERMIEPGDFTGPQGARAVLARPEVELAVLETARGGILLRGLGYQSNDASVLTNVSGDHLDLQGLHTLPELAEVKSVVCRVTRPNGAVVLNADDPLVVAVGRNVQAPVWLFSLRPRSALVRAHLAAGRRAYVFDDGWLAECNGRRTTRIVAVAEVRATLGGLARYVVANALAAAGGARALGFTIDEIAAGLRDFDNSPTLMPGRLNLYAQGNRLVIVDYAHNVAGLEVLIDTAEALIGRRGHRRATLSVAIGSAGDRPDDYIRGIGRIAGSRADEVAIKEGLPYLRGRSRASVIGELREGLHQAGASATAVPIYEDELDAIRGELTTPGRLAARDDDTPRVLFVMTHRLRGEIAEFLAGAGFVSITDPADLEGFRRRS
jgi:cyanophycin synthetase